MSSTSRFLLFLCGLTFWFGASAQDFGNEWAEFQNEDSRLVADAVVGVDDTEEKDYAVGDFDKDGWLDLVVVRKEGWHTTGRRTNVLFMNENGTLVDRTAQYAATADVFGDLGFLTPTNDRDVVVTDVNQDTWPDIVTATTLSPGLPKHISHPRVYLNLGEDPQGDWQGFRFENDRIPQLLDNAAPTFPRFTAVDAGDLTDDGFPELYFGDNDNAPEVGGGDLNDRLLVNDGTGHFDDETTLRMSADMYDVQYTTAVVIEDMNRDDLHDVLRDRGHFEQISLIYNDPQNIGFFDPDQTIDLGAPYYTNVGDLNNDGWLDLIVSHNQQDRYLLSQGVDTEGLVQWPAAQLFELLTGADDGFGADNYAADLDRDGFEDVVITDVDPEIPGCTRRTHIYHNLGGLAGSAVTLREEAEQQSGGWRGVVGLLAADLQGTHDAAIFDIDGDQDLDMVLGRCTGTNVWINVTVPPVTGGRTPDGSDGTPLLINRVPNGSLRLSWGASCAPADVDYGVYSGTLDDFNASVPVQCSTGGSRLVVIPPPNGSAFFLVVPHNTVIEGSYGLDSGGIERPASAAACYTQSIGTCE